MIAKDLKSPTINKYVLKQQCCFLNFNLKIPNSKFQAKIYILKSKI
ncbi:hypothetical protein NU08_2879 [Flavobacterium anhuiense]|uniref:Uncharacterized protein n=1 Tax=Flavobacterium anhuiense TaxID=459526 RepID=A0A444VWQ5_9FLAO|nr:hypothetical protein NU08_2879 [Flavobacterium anhuiense]